MPSPCDRDRGGGYDRDDRDRGGGERDHGGCGRPPLDPFDRRLEVGRDNVAHNDLVS